MGNLAEFNIDPNQEQEAGSYAPIPNGEYVVAIVASEMKTTKAGTGKYLSLEFEVQGPTCTGRKIFEKLNLLNPSAKAMEIAKASLSSICRAIGVLSPKDSSELHNKPVLAKVITEQQEGYDAQNKIVMYKPATATPGAPAAIPARKPRTVGQAKSAAEAMVAPPPDVGSKAYAQDIPF